ncbi:site-specific DNA recombinase [Streptococcus rupicaprae]|uniref:Site-specific DNA recombinase n=1 Tax=Streptococcus rupicaprae TaxID=759619 RepID=A0ABV2FL42_9STRE
MTRKVAVYVRVSTTNQVEEGYSIDGQLDSLTKYCEAMGWSIYNKYIDAGFSGGKLDRPDMMKLIREAKKGLFDTVLVYKLDRLSRNVRDTLYLVKEVFNQNDVHFVSLQENLDTSSAMGNLFLTLLSAIAEFEREQIKERMQLGKLGRAKAGKSMMWAKTSYGYDYHKETGEMTINELEAIVIREIFQSYLGGRSITKLRDDINQRYPKTPAWSYRIIRQILGNPVYCGYNQYKGEIYKGNHEPIISKEMYDKVQEELKIRQIAAYQANNNPRPFQAKYMLSGIAQCGYCHAPLTIIMGMVRKDGTRFIKYECVQRYPKKTKGVTVYNNNEKCDSSYYYKDDIEAYVLKEISRLQNDTDYLDEIFDGSETESIDRESYQKQIDELTKKISRLNDLYIDDRITLEELQKKSAEFTTMRTLLEEELENDPALKQQEKKEVMRKILGAEDIFSMDYERQKIMVRGLINKVRVKAESIKIMWKI